MRTKFRVIAFWVVLIVGGVSAQQLNIESNAHLQVDVHMNHYIVTSQGKDLSINCNLAGGGILKNQKSPGVRWKLANNSDFMGFDNQNFLERVTESESESDSWIRELRISDAKVSDTGAYTCYQAGNEGNNIEVYVYVKDDEVFLKPAISGLRVDERHFVVPCRATYPPAEGSVKLFVNDKEWVSARGKYDPRIGFELRTRDLEEKKIDQKKFRCEHENGGRKPEFIIMVKKDVDPFSLSLEMAPQDEWAFVGAVNFSLTCSLKGRLESAYKHKLNVTCPRCSNQDFVTQKFGYLEKKGGVKVVVNIAKVDMADAGQYRCKWYKENSGAGGFDLANETVHELEVSATMGQLKFEQQIPDNALEVFEGDPIDLKAYIAAFPSDLPNYSAKWIKHHVPLGKAENRTDNVLSDGSRKTDSRKAGEGRTVEELRIHRAAVSDSGFYVLSAEVKGFRRPLEWSVSVKNRQPEAEVRIASSATPSWAFLDQKYYKKGTVLSVQCVVTGLPLATPKLYRKRTKSQPYLDVPYSELLVLEGTYERALAWNHTVDDDVFVKCEGERDIEVPKALYSVHNKAVVSDEKVIRMGNAPNVDIEVKKSEQKTETEDKEVYDGDDVTLRCTVPADEKISLQWTFQGEVLEEALIGGKSHEKVLTAELKNVSASRSGDYICEVSTPNGRKTMDPQQRLRLKVHKTMLPTVVEQSGDRKLKYSEEATIECKMEGTPRPELHWLKDGASLGKESGLDFSEDGRVLKFRRVVEEDAGRYECVGKNRAGQQTMTVDVEVEGAPSSSFVGLALTIGLICLSVLCAAFIFSYCRVLKKARETESALGVLYDQLMRSVNPIDPLPDHEAKQLPIEERLNQIPYDRQFEVESTNLQIGELLGRGQFGKVCMGWLSQPARVSDSVAERKRLPVAVKMPLNGHDVQHQRMLVEELKIMTHIRPHPNVLSLVGAVTKNMKSGKLFVVVEMCDNRSLKDFLVAFKRRPGAFMDELREAPSDGYLAPNSRPKRIYAAELSDEIEPNRPDSESDRLLYEKSTTLLSTSDLLSFSMQVANGMEYLSSIPCIHRDLAARNVLVTKDRLCRIADFGMARREQKDYYRMRKSRDIPMPFRWMSPEAVENALFSQASDVWSFGILLYEIFSLGGNPYPEWANDEVMERLRKGERNRQPQHAHDEVYSLMKQCWDFEASQRPLFTDCLHLLKEHLKLASSELFERVERLMSEEWAKLESYADWRGEDEPEPHNVLVDRPIQENGDTERIYVQEFPRKQ